MLFDIIFCRAADKAICQEERDARKAASFYYNVMGNHTIREMQKVALSLSLLFFQTKIRSHEKNLFHAEVLVTHLYRPRT